MKILIVDDCRLTTSHLSGILKQIGYSEPVAAHSFEEAMEVLESSTHSKTGIDLILMDISMPGTDGIAATLTIKSRYEFEDIPVIVVTNHDEEAILDRSFAAGASDYIVKPAGKVELRARIRSALQLRREMTKRKQRERELEQLARELEKMSNIDGLTGLANRRCFDDTLVKEWVRNGRMDASIGLLMVDIDHFKAYNDTLGHVDGDICLRAVAQAIQGSIHRPGDMAARYGGEEFAIILPDTDYEGAKAVAENIHANISKTCLSHPSSSVGCTVTVSIGVAAGIPTCGTTPEHLLHAADCALYEAKQSGRNCTSTVCLPGPDEIRQ